MEGPGLHKAAAVTVKWKGARVTSRAGDTEVAGKPLQKQLPWGWGATEGTQDVVLENPWRRNPIITKSGACSIKGWGYFLLIEKGWLKTIFIWWLREGRDGVAGDTGENWGPQWRPVSQVNWRKSHFLWVDLESWGQASCLIFLPALLWESDGIFYSPCIVNDKVPYNASQTQAG